MKKVISCMLAFAMVFTMLTVPASAATTETVANASNNVAKIEAATADYSGGKFQVRYNVKVKEGEIITFKFKPYSEATAITVRDGSGSDHTKFLAAGALDGSNQRVISIGDGWYYVVVEATTTCTKLGIACDDNGKTGSVMYVDDLKIGDADAITFDDEAQVKKFVSFYDYPTDIKVSKETMSTTWQMPTEVVIVGDPTEYVAPTITPAKIDAAPYTWTVNKELGGAEGLPAVVLDGTSSNVNDQLYGAMKTTKFADAKNIIFIISDGYGLDEVKLAEAHGGNMLMNDLPNKAESMTASYSETSKTLRITDSAAGGTALSTGYKTAYYNEAIDFEGKDLPQITELLRAQQNKKIGVVTTGWISDATPAVYGGAHAVRGESSKIMEQMLLFAPDILVGSGAGDYDSIVNANSSFVKAQDIGYYDNWSKAVASTNKKLLVGIPDDVRYTQSATDSVPTISQMMAFSLAWLQKNSGDDGFFLMFENGMTDDAGHNNNPTQMVGEAHNTDEVLAVALKFALENPDTIIILTADHETGGLTLKDGWETDLTKAKFTTSGHSIQNVPVYAIGKGTEIFNGLTLLNSQVGKITGYLAGLKDFGDPEVTMLPDGVTIPDKVEEYIPTEGIKDIVAAKADANGIEFTVDGLKINNGEMISVMVKPYASAKTMSVTGANIADIWLNDSPLDGVVNYVRDGWYNVTVKAHAADTALKFTFKGAAAAGDKVEIADLIIGNTPADLSKIISQDGTPITPVDPTPVDPTPVDPTPVDPTPVDPGKTDYNYSDVSANFVNYANKLLSMDLVAGKGGDAGLALEDMVTREQAVALMLVFMNEKATADAMSDAEADTILNAAYSDASSISAWAKKLLAFATQKGYINGKTSSTRTDIWYDPQGEVTGREFSTILLNAMGYSTQSDYTFATAIDYVVAKDGFCGADSDKGYIGKLGTTPLRRSEAFAEMYGILGTTRKDNVKQLQFLITSGKVDANAAKAAGF